LTFLKIWKSWKYLLCVKINTADIQLISGSEIFIGFDLCTLYYFRALAPDNSFPSIIPTRFLWVQLSSFGWVRIKLVSTGTLVFFVGPQTLMRFGVLKLELVIVMHIVQLLCEIYIVHTQYIRLSELLLRNVVYEYFSWQQFSIKALRMPEWEGYVYARGRSSDREVWLPFSWLSWELCWVEGRLIDASFDRWFEVVSRY